MLRCTGPDRHKITGSGRHKVYCGDRSDIVGMVCTLRCRAKLVSAAWQKALLQARLAQRELVWVFAATLGGCHNGSIGRIATEPICRNMPAIGPKSELVPEGNK